MTVSDHWKIGLSKEASRIYLTPGMVSLYTSSYASNCVQLFSLPEQHFSLSTLKTVSCHRFWRGSLRHEKSVQWCSMWWGEEMVYWIIGQRYMDVLVLNFLFFFLFWGVSFLQSKFLLWCCLNSQSHQNTFLLGNEKQWWNWCWVLAVPTQHCGPLPGLQMCFLVNQCMTQQTNNIFHMTFIDTCIWLAMFQGHGSP